jgi:LmbE family N-acetylglucosaminyl deacetylase
MATGQFVQALAIQLPDIGLAFGTVGTAVGLLAGIALPMLVSAFSSTSSEALPLEERIDALSGAVSRYRDAAAAARQPTDELTASYGSLASAADRALDATAMSERAAAFRALGLEVQTITSTFGGFATVAGDAMSSLESESEQTLARIRDELGITALDAVRVMAAFEALSLAEGPVNVANAAAAARDALLAAGVAADNDLVIALNNAELAAAGLAAETGYVKNAADQLSTAMDAVIAKYAMTRTIGGQVLKNMLDTADAAATLAQMQLADRGMVYGKVGARGDPRKTTPAGASPFVYGGPNLDAFNNPIAERGGAANPIQGQLEALQESLMSQEQLETESFARRQEMLNSALQQRLLSQEEHARLMEQVEKTHQFAMTKATNDGVQSTLSHLGQLFQGSKKIGAAIALANSWMAFTEVLKDPSYIGRPFARFAAAGAALASGLNAVRSIKAASPGASGGASAGGAGAGASAAMAGGGGGAAAQQTSNISLQLVGGDLFSRDQVIRLINSINEATADGARISLR